MLEGNLRDKTVTLLCIILVMMMITGLLVNIWVLLIFFKNKKLHKPANFFTVMLLTFNLVCILSYFPFAIYGSYYRELPFGYVGCQLQALLFFFTGCVYLHLLLILSIERYFIVFKPNYIITLTLKNCYFIMTFVLSWSLLWSLFPIFGWSRYTYELEKFHCSMEYNDRSWNVLSFNLSTCILNWFIPLSITIYTNSRLFHVLKNRQNFYNFVSPVQSNLDHKSHQLYGIIMLNIGYLISWTPYIFIIIYGAFTDDVRSKTLWTLVAVIMCKMIIFWSPILEMIFNLNVRRNLLFTHRPETPTDAFVMQELNRS